MHYFAFKLKELFSHLIFVSWIDFQAYWPIVLNELSVEFHEPPKCILDRTDKLKPGGVWLPGATLNIAECCLQPSNHPRKEDDSPAVVWRDDRCDDSPVNHLTLKELREQVMYAFTYNLKFVCVYLIVM